MQLRWDVEDSQLSRCGPWLLSALGVTGRCMTGINFVKEGARPENKKVWKTTSVLDRGGDWELRVDLDRKLVFPEIVDTTLR